MNSAEIRQKFYNFFIEKNHQQVASSSLVPHNDPSLLFTNAGMVQFKEYFLGLESRPYTRAVSVQRCVRAGGKHNDLDNVGYTARHHTFFEMLGNFSFGDYFKQEAIGYAWEFLTKVLKLPEEKLWVTVYERDEETADIWLKDMNISPQRFSRCGEKDNFWSMGDTGPCGPCTEIFYDHGADIPGGPPGSPDADGDRYIEIWNLVFMQFNRDKSGQLHPLPKPSVDTGMGLERITAVVQGVHNNYQIDSFKQLIQAIHQYVPQAAIDNPSLNVIADHIRSCAFLIADGVVPSNEGRGYVLRRITRRAIRHGNKLGIKDHFYSRLVSPLIAVMGTAYPELKTNQTLIEKLLEQEETQFARTLEQGLLLLKSKIEDLTTTKIAGDVAFKLYDTYGFPLDLTEDIAREQGLEVDTVGFELCMQQQRQQSQLGNAFETDYTQQLVSSERTVFHGYNTASMPSTIIGLVHNGKQVEQLTKGQKGVIILDNTPFYAESGGQVGDLGFIYFADNKFQVTDTQRNKEAVFHLGKMLSGSLANQSEVIAEIDSERRSAIRLNHTATHLLHAVLKIQLGAHVQQKGSLVDASRARFDFSHFEAVTPAQLATIEQQVNDYIRANVVVQTQEMSLDDAKNDGAMALFGEKYCETVRVLTMGELSKELCGGTHACRTGDLGLFKIVAEYGIASGVRRIEMVTGFYALQWVNEQLAQLGQAAQLLKTNTPQLLDKLKQFMQENKQQERHAQQLQTELAALSGKNLAGEVVVSQGKNILIKKIDGDAQILRSTIDQLKSQLPNAVVVLYTISADKINIIASVSKPLIDQEISAPKLVKQLCGKGGGRDDMAQGGGVIPDDFSERLSCLKKMLIID